MTPAPVDVTPPPDREHSTGLLGALQRIPTFQALQYPRFRLLWFGQIGGGLAQWMDQVARGWLMYELTNSALQLGAVIAIRALPLLLLSPLAGTMADRYSRRRQLMVAQSVDLSLYTVTALLIWSGHIAPWHVYLLAFGSAVVQVFQGPARQVLISETVPPRDLTNAIGINSIAWNGSRTVGPAVAGALIAAVGTAGCYAVQALLLAVATFWTWQMGPDQGSRSAMEAGKRRLSWLSSAAQGWQFALHDETVRAGMMVTALAACFAQSFITLLPVFARDVLAVGSTGQGLMLTGMGVGALSSAVLIASLGGRLPRGLLMILSAAVYGLVLVAFAASTWLPLSILFMVGAGAANVFCNALVQTVVQAYSPPELRGRVMGIFQQREVAYTAGSMLVGALAATWGAPLALAMNGTICALAAITMLVTMPHIRAIR